MAMMSWGLSNVCATWAAGAEAGAPIFLAPPANAAEMT